jgi:hypothetical protein
MNELKLRMMLAVTADILDELRHHVHAPEHMDAMLTELSALLSNSANTGAYITLDDVKHMRH